MLASVGERLLKTLSIQHLGFFLAEERMRPGPVFRLHEAHGKQSAAVASRRTRTWI